MVIEIVGAGQQNKGAELMLLTVIGELKRRLPQVQIVIDPYYINQKFAYDEKVFFVTPAKGHVGSAGYGKRLLKYSLLTNSIFSRALKSLFGLYPSSYGVYTSDQVTSVIDISGFAFSDQWGFAPLNDLVSLTKLNKSKKRPYILFPQAFGPFNNFQSKKAMRRAVGNSTMIYARDSISYNYLIDGLESGNRAKIKIAPDITLFGQQQVWELDKISDYVCLVPNTRVIDKKNHQGLNKYFRWFEAAAEVISHAGKKIFITIHDVSGDDRELCEQLSHILFEKNIQHEMVEEHDPLKLKLFIQNSYLVFGSRYHSLVSSFSNAIPSFCIGWSHKYDELYGDFGLKEHVIEINNDVEQIHDLLTNILDLQKYKQIRKRLVGHLTIMREQNEVMWAEVLNCLK